MRASLQNCHASPVTLLAVIICIWLTAPYSPGQTRERIQRPIPLKLFFERILQNPSSLPQFEQLHELTLDIGGVRAEDITSALPAVFAALGSENENVKAYACAALFAIAGRPDGTGLLRSRVGLIGQDLLSTREANIRAGEIAILGSLRPSPPPEVVSIFLDFLKQRDPELRAQGAGVIFQLVHIAPEDPRVTEAVREFLTLPMDKKLKIDTVNALGNPQLRDTSITLMVVSLLDDMDTDVRATAIQAITRMGRHALELAEPALVRLAADSTQPENVTKDAKRALQLLDRMREK